MRKLIFTFCYPFGNFSQGVFSAFTNSLLPLYLINFTKNTSLIGILVTVSLFENSLAPLIVGPLSDRIESPVGRRKIFIIAGGALTVILLLLIPFAKTLNSLIILILVLGFCKSLTSAPIMAMLPSNSTLQSRSKVAAFLSIAALAGQVALTALAAKLWPNSITSSLFWVIALLFTGSLLPLLFFSRDLTKLEGDKSHHLHRDFRQFFSENKPRNRYLLSQVLIWFGIYSVLPFFTIFIKSGLHQPQRESIILYLILILATGLFAYPFALLGKKIGEYKAFSIGLLAFAFAALLGFSAPVLPVQFLPLIAFFAGFGYASTAVYSFSLLTKMVPANSIGQASGVQAFISTGFSPVAAFISGWLIGIFGFGAMFVLMALTTLIALLLLNLKPVHLPQASPEPVL